MSDVLLMLGTRPELTKTSPFILEMMRQGIDFSFVFTGQHYDSEMSSIFMKEFGLPKPDKVLGIGGVDEFTQFGVGMKRLADAIKQYKPKLCIVNGDTNSTLMSALASAKSGVPVAHIEAGCRSFDFTMPEEINRILTDRVCQLLFPSTQYCKENLIMEGFDRSKVFMLGNTAVDGFKMMVPRAKKSKIVGELGLERGTYALVTLHRKENVDNRKTLRELLTALSKLEGGVVFPMHPRTMNRIGKFGLGRFLASRNIIVTKPMGYLDFLSLLLDCKYVITDSGGVMEEAVMAGKRVIVPRKNIEWYEIIESGAGVLCKPEEKRLLGAVDGIGRAKGKVPAIYPDLKASRRIANTVKRKLSEGFVLGSDFFKNGRRSMALDLEGDILAMFGKDGRMVDDAKKAVHKTVNMRVRCGD
ncbi:MAG: UDP-N-acetylglucosamine 2-epimerase (non-hydrolyzing) [Candidatus Micrarchaeota archaeon]